MPTQVISARVDSNKLKEANRITQKQCGMSFAQYCSKVVLEDVASSKKLPVNKKAEYEKRERGLQAVRHIQEISKKLKGSEIASMTDEEVRQFIRNRDI